MSTPLKIVDRWHRIAWPAALFVPSTAAVAVALALHPSPTAPHPASFALGLLVMLGIGWFWPLGRHAIVDDEGITTWRMGSVEHGRALTRPAQVQRIEVGVGSVFVRVRLVTATATIPLTTMLRVTGSTRAHALAADVAARLGTQVVSAPG